MEIVYDDEELARFVVTAAAASPDHPVLIDRFLEGAIEVDVDAVCDGDRRVRRRGDGAHRGGGGALGRLARARSRPRRCPTSELDEVEKITATLARRLGVHGLINLQLAVKDERIWVLEANPRASRTVPFVSKATGVPAREGRHPRAARRARSATWPRRDRCPRIRTGTATCRTPR